jgi:CRP-like cAMP-binding protein
MTNEDRNRLLPNLRPVDMAQGAILYEAGSTITHAYFPLVGVGSAVSVYADGTVAEMATTGTEGVFPVAAVLEGNIAIAQHMVQVQGRALVIDLAALRGAVEASRGLRRLLHCYVQAFIAQVSYSVTCNALHSTEARFARWLLMSQDRAGTDSTVALTQTFVAEMLGVQRPTVTLIARRFQRAGLIAYRRGVITVLDRAGLEEAACECYAIIRDEYDRHLPDPPAPA